MELFPLLFFEHLAGNFIALALCRNFLHETPPPLIYTSDLFTGIIRDLIVYETPTSPFFWTRIMYESPLFFAIFRALI